MKYGIKKKENSSWHLSRVKDLLTLTPGDSYHIRKKLKQEGNVIFDESYDVILKEFKDNVFITQDSEYKIGVDDFEIFVKNK